MDAGLAQLHEKIHWSFGIQPAARNVIASKALPKKSLVLISVPMDYWPPSGLARVVSNYGICAQEKGLGRLLTTRKHYINRALTTSSLRLTAVPLLLDGILRRLN